MFTDSFMRLLIKCSGTLLLASSPAFAQTAAPKINWGQTDSATSATPPVPRANEQQMQQRNNSLRPSAQSNVPAAVPGQRVVAHANSAATIARLKAAGLDTTDPGLAAKHKARMQSTTTAYKRARTSTIKIAPKTPQLLGTRDFAASKQSRANLIASNPGIVAGVGSLGGGVSAPNASFVSLDQISPAKVQGDRLWQSDHTYMVLVTTPKSLSGTAPFPASVTFKSDCNVNSVMNASINNLGIGIQQNFNPPRDNRQYYYLMLPVTGFDLGASPHNLQIAMAGSVNGSFSMPAVSRRATATITLLIDSAPPFMSANNYGFDKSRAHFSAPDTARSDPGANLNATTSGEDTLGFGVNLGAGWSVKNTRIVSAHSGLDAPNNSEPDNVFRGAVVTQSPAAGRLQTVVRWHYGAFESLSYTIQWELEGPGGQRPLMTMPLGGPCDS